MEFRLKHKDFIITVSAEIENDFVSINYRDFYQFLTKEQFRFLANYEKDIWYTATTFDLDDIRRGLLLGLVTCILESTVSSDLYFLLSECGLIKIGKSNNVSKRKAKLEYDLGEKLTLLKSVSYAESYEKLLHSKFESDNIIYKNQTEWFHPTNKLIKFISKVDERNIQTLFEKL